MVRRGIGLTMRTLLRLSLATAALSAAVVANAELVYGVTFDNQLVTFDSATPDNILSGLYLNGMNGADIAGIDFRPATGELFVLATNSNLYTANLSNGTLTQVSTLSSVLNGTVFGVDFNPTVDRLRITSDTQQNLRVNVASGAALVDGNVTVTGVTAPNVTGAAYTNNVAGATTTTLYGLETKSNSLVQFTNPNAGTATIVGNLNIPASGLNGFDISGRTGIAYAAIQLENVPGSKLYTINLGTGAASLLGEIGGSSSVVNIRALTVAPAPVPEPAAIATIGLGIVGLLRRRKKA